MNDAGLFAYFAERKLKQWLSDFQKLPSGNKSRILLHIIVGKSGEKRANEIVIPISFRSDVKIYFCPIYLVSLN